MSKKILLYVSFLLMVFSIVGISYISFNASKVLAGNDRQLTGYAWSSTIGWIDMRGASQNGVKVDDSGNVIGFAWSSNIGWIKFGGLSSFPAEIGNYRGNAQLVEGTFDGWARACAGTQNKDCASVSRTDGWDGWISLKGTTHIITVTGTGGPTPYSKLLTGYAWGDVNVGWIDMSGVSIVYNPPTAPTNVTAVADTCGSIIVSWDTVASVNGQVEYDVFRNDGITYGSNTGTTLINTIGVNNKFYTYTVTARDNVGSSEPSPGTTPVKFVTCPQAPSIGSFTASPSSIRKGGTCTLTWTAITNVDPSEPTRQSPKDSCVITGNGGFRFSPVYEVSNFPTGSVTTAALNAEERFVITCNNGTTPHAVKTAKCNVTGDIKEF